MTQAERHELRGKLYVAQKWYFMLQLISMLFVVGTWGIFSKHTMVVASVFAGTNLLLTLLMMWDTRKMKQDARKHDHW
ncbi:hypothetical protein UXN85_20820 [Enterobacter hormaechei]